MRIAYCVVVLITAAPAALPDTTNVKPIHVPYRLTKTQHILVRAKINGKGSYNFIVDTGAPALFVSKKTADAAGVNPDKRGWATFDRFEVEGGVVLQGQAGKIDDLFQLEGMNGLGLAGAEIHGVIGYSVLAQYRIEYDFTQPKLSWTKLDYRPPAVGESGAGLPLRGWTCSAA